MPIRSSRRPGYVSLDRALSKLGLCSRTQARVLIENGKVRVSGAVRTNPGFQVFPEKSRIEIDGAAARVTERVYMVLYKPRGVVTTRADERGRATVFSLIPADEHKRWGHLSAVGRLDFATSGLLVITNDTQFAAWLTDPANAIPRVYAVSVRGEVTESKVERLRNGIIHDGDGLRAEGVELRKASGKESHLIVTLCEGKNREIRRMFDSLGNEVTRLKRVAYGGLELGNLRPGEYRILSVDEVKKAFSSFLKN